MKATASMKPVWATVIVVGALMLASKVAMAEAAAKAPAVVDGDNAAVSTTGSMGTGQAGHVDAADIREPAVIDPDIHDVGTDVREPEIESPPDFQSPDFQMPGFEAPDVPVSGPPDLPDIPESH